MGHPQLAPEKLLVVTDYWFIEKLYLEEDGVSKPFIFPLTEWNFTDTVIQIDYYE
jgi:hypothetical protein